MHPGLWAESTQPGLVRELSVDSDMSVTVVVRVPSDYDGVLLGINATDPADPPREFKADWDLTTDTSAHYRFIRLSDAGASIKS